MKLTLKPEAENALLEIGLWVEGRNTPGSGSRFIDKLIDKIAGYALPRVKYPVCGNTILAELLLSCISIDNWVVAFHQTNDELIVHYIIYGPGLR
ncbi:MAG: hypothetical protein JWO03_2908 [Bacteroidetes bacterium]|nr:hypothetical protein [Bacteroidota bacterium]